MLSNSGCCVLLIVLLMSGCSCSDSGNLFNSSDPVPGAKYAYANGELERGISLVSLVFRNWENVGNLSVTDRITGEPIHFHTVVLDGMTVVTLKLTHGQLVKPYLVFDKDASFTALLTPSHSLSTFDGLSFGNHTVFLRDHGVEKELQIGETTEFLPEELAWLWLGDKLALAARVHIVNISDAGGIKLQAPPGCKTVVVQKNQLHINNLNSGDRLAVVPANETENLSLSLTH